MTDEDCAFLALMQEKYPKHVEIGKHTGQVRLYEKAWDAVRVYVWTREGGICQGCGDSTLIKKGDWRSMHTAHMKSKGSGGDDLPYNLRCLCGQCHAHEHSGKKV